MLKTGANIIPGYNGKYDITSDGRVYSYNYGRRTELKLSEHKGYRRTTLSKDNKRKMIPVHVLVAKAFIPNPLNKPFVNHIDGNRKNNDVSNLEWCTREENWEHAKTVLGNNGKGSKNPNYGYRKSRFYPSKELRNRLLELGVPYYKHDIVSLGEMLPPIVEKDGTEFICQMGKYGRDEKFVKEWEVAYIADDYENLPICRADTEADARAAMLIYLLENKLFTL